MIVIESVAAAIVQAWVEALQKKYVATF